MNAPATPMQLAVELLPLDHIVTSHTQIQQLRRKRFSPDALQQLADSIKTQGVLQAILVRPIEKAPIDAEIYEIVAGERRYIAAKMAGLTHIPAQVRELNDTQALEAQLVENLQREGLDAIEEAEGYAELRTLTGKSADELAAEIGKSRSYVYARLKLLALSAEGREALTKGKIDDSKALILARLHPKLQKKALEIFGNDWRSFRSMLDDIKRHLLQQLNGAPFALDDATLEIEVTIPGQTRKLKSWHIVQACNGCDDNSSSDPELAAAIGANVCTNTECFEAKCKAATARRRQAAEASGKMIIHNDEVHKYNYQGWQPEYVDLDSICDDDTLQEDEPNESKYDSDEAYQAACDALYDRQDAYQSRTYRQILGDVKADTVFLDTGKALVEVVKYNDIVPALKKAGIDAQPISQLHAPAAVERETPEQRAAREAKEQEKREIEEATDLAVLKAINAKWKLPLKRADIDIMVNRWYVEQGAELLGVDIKDHAKLKDEDVLRFYILAMADENGELDALAGRCNIDVKKIRADVVKARKAASTPEKAAAKTAKKAPAKKAAKK